MNSIMNNSSIGITKGDIFGVNHSYIADGVWGRCDCGSEILEIIQCEPLETLEKYEYQIRCFGGNNRNQEDSWHSCFVCSKNEIRRIIAALQNQRYVFSFCEAPDSKYWLKIKREMENWVNVFLVKKHPNRTNVIWECCFPTKVAKQIANKLKKMLKKEEEKYGKM